MLGCLAGMWMGREETNEYIYILVLFDALHLHHYHHGGTPLHLGTKLWTTGLAHVSN